MKFEEEKQKAKKKNLRHATANEKQGRTKKSYMNFSMIPTGLMKK